MVLAPSESDRLERRPMSRVEFDALPDGVRAEYVDRVAVVTPPPSLGHNLVAGLVMRRLQEALPELLVAHEVGLNLGNSLRIPDVAVLRHFDGVSWQTQAPLLVVEILSAGTRSEDMLRKPAEYLAGGVDHYWIVDRQAGRVTVLAARGADWVITHEVDDTSPVAEVLVGQHGTVEFDVRTLIPMEFRG